jgi:uncharacterized metal-binding protein
MNNCSNMKSNPSSQCGSNNKLGRVCGDGLRYVQNELKSPPKKAVLACEGGCLKGEVARVAANILAYKLQREAAVRICLGDAATGNSGFIDLINRAPEIIALEGCPLKCGTEIMRRRIPDLKTTIIDVSTLYQFDRSKYFEIFDMPRTEIEEHAYKVAEYVQDHFFKDHSEKTCCSSTDCCE